LNSITRLPSELKLLTLNLKTQQYSLAFNSIDNPHALVHGMCIHYCKTIAENLGASLVQKKCTGILEDSIP
jgi:hypothetical protein